MTTLVFIGLGTNQGDRFYNLRQAVLKLPPKVVPLKLSSVYETPPWGFLEQPYFLNQVIKAHTRLSPPSLLKYLKHIERRVGRQPTFRYGPRLIDLDILFYDNQIFESSELVIPHPDLHNRAFVLIPLAEIEPDFHHPVLGKTIKELLPAVDSRGIHPYYQDTDEIALNRS